MGNVHSSFRRVAWSSSAACILLTSPKRFPAVILVCCVEFDPPRFGTVVHELCDCREDWTEEHDPQTYYPDIAPRAKAGDSVRSGSGFPQVRQEGPGRYEMAAPAMPPAPTTATILA